MSSQKLRELCQKYFETEDLYEILGLKKSATNKEVKSAYRRMSLKIHPDRVEEHEKEESTEKFKVLSKIHAVLSDPQKKKAYDDNGDLDEDVDGDWLSYWRVVFKAVTVEDIGNYEKKYKNSEEERGDLKVAYEDYEGDMDRIMETVLFAQMEDEPRLKGILQDMIDKGEIEDLPAFSDEPETKKKRRENKMKRQRSDFEKMQKKKKESEGGEGDDLKSLQMAIMQNRANREMKATNFLEALEKKYTNPPAAGTKKGSKRSSRKK